MSQHIGIVACSAEGAALCYRTICTEGARFLGPHAHPEVSVHTPSLATYVDFLDRGDLQGTAERDGMNRIIMDELVCGVFKPEGIAYFQGVIERMKGEGCDAVVLGCTEIPLILSDANSPLPTLDSTRLLARAAPGDRHPDGVKGFSGDRP